jgi:hypothetical protein
MQEARTYRQYAADCRRLAERMEKKDRAVLLNMAEAWDSRADEAERLATKKNGGKEDQHQGK